MPLESLGYSLAKLVNIIADILLFLIFVRVILSWVSPHARHHRVVEIIETLTEPVMRVARLFPHTIGMIDLSPIVAWIGIFILRHILISFFLMF